MMALLIKDWRLNSPAIVAWLVAFIAMPVASILVVLAEWRPQPYDPTSELAEAALVGIVAALATASIIVPAFGAISFARERRDRSAEHLHSMPVSRIRIVASKVIVTLTLAALPWAGAAIMLFAIGIVWPSHHMSWSEFSTRPDRDVFPVLIHLQVMLLGISWFLSSMLRSEVIATSVTILTTVILVVAWRVLVDRMYMRGIDVYEAAIRIGWDGSLYLGILGFIAGTAIALRRISP